MQSKTGDLAKSVNMSQEGTEQTLSDEVKKQPNDEISWIIFSYKVPPQPSTLRVRIWRTLKALGVVYIQQSVCVVPDTTEVRKKLNAIIKLIESSEGEALLLEVSKFSPNTVTQLLELFNKQRNAEYEEFLEGCNKFIKEIEYETHKSNFTFYEIEENEADLEKLKRWYKKILKRDFFSAHKGIEAKNTLEICEKLFAEFTDKIYQSEGNFEGNIELES
jgi:ribosomal protein L30/L7E